MNPYFLFALAAVIAAGGYGISLARRPWNDCRVCKGGGRDRGAIYKHAYRECDACGGGGKVPRAGLRIFRRARAEALKWGKPRPTRRLP